MNQYVSMMPYVDIDKEKKFEWIAIWDQYANKAILGHVVNKHPQSQSIIVQHFNHFLDSDVLSPTYQKPVGSFILCWL
jgi:hypothetical protein